MWSMPQTHQSPTQLQWHLHFSPCLLLFLSPCWYWPLNHLNLSFSATGCTQSLTLLPQNVSFHYHWACRLESFLGFYFQSSTSKVMEWLVQSWTKPQTEVSEGRKSAVCPHVQEDTPGQRALLLVEVSSLGI